MIIEIPDDNSTVKWKYKDNEAWKSAEISDLINAYEERPKGEWIDHSCYKGVIICSNCGIGGNHFYKDFKYCPNCGADMKGGADNEETDK